MSSLFPIAVCLIVLLPAGCGRSRPSERQARDYPAAFVPIDSAGAGNEGCAIRLRDPRDGTVLLLRRSETRQQRSEQGGAMVTHYLAMGDYEVLTPGRYGVTSDQWLRVDCTNGQPVGPVARST